MPEGLADEIRDTNNVYHTTSNVTLRDFEDMINTLRTRDNRRVDYNNPEIFGLDAIKIYVDSNFINMCQNVLPNSKLKHYGFGEFYLETADDDTVHAGGGYR